MRILIVDDENDIVELIAEECQLAGHDVSVAYHGDQARDLCLEKDFDLILTDLNMPRLSGVQLIQWLGSNSNKACIIVVMTASIAAHPDLDLKMVDHLILKPFPLPELMHVIQHYAEVKDTVSQD